MLSVFLFLLIITFVFNIYFMFIVNPTAKEGNRFKNNWNEGGWVFALLSFGSVLLLSFLLHLIINLT